MYSQIRNYIWGFNTVEKLANLEIAVYSSFPDISTIQSYFNSLYSDMRDIMSEDEELAEAVNKFKNTLDSLEGDFYVKLNKVQEVV